MVDHCPGCVFFQFVVMFFIQSEEVLTGMWSALHSYTEEVRIVDAEFQYHCYSPHCSMISISSLSSLMNRSCFSIRENEASFFPGFLRSGIQQINVQLFSSFAWYIFPSSSSKNITSLLGILPGNNGGNRSYYLYGEILSASHTHSREPIHLIVIY